MDNIKKIAKEILEKKSKSFQKVDSLKDQLAKNMVEFYQSQGWDAAKIKKNVNTKILDT